MKVALTAYGIPFPIPHIVGELTNELRGTILEQVSSVVTDFVTESKDDLIGDSIQTIDENLSKLTNPETSDRIKIKKLESLQRETNDFYSNEFHHLLFDLENSGNRIVYNSNWKPRYTGLSFEMSRKNGESAWVSKEGKDLFLRDGSASFK